MHYIYKTGYLKFSAQNSGYILSSDNFLSNPLAYTIQSKYDIVSNSHMSVSITELIQ